MSKISVVMPVYNGEKYLKQAIDSILDQTERDFEFIIIDDGSTDSSKEILKEYEKRDSRIKLLLRPHRGLVVSLNEAVGSAQSVYVARMDSDDISLPKRLEKQLLFIENKDLSVCGTWAEGIDKGDHKINEMIYPPESPSVVRSFLLLHNAFIHPSVMFRKDVFTEVGGYKSFFHRVEDYELWTRMVKRHRGGNIPEILLRYRLHENQVTRKHHSKMIFMGIIVRVLALVRQSSIREVKGRAL